MVGFDRLRLRRVILPVTLRKFCAVVFTVDLLNAVLMLDVLMTSSVTVNASVRVTDPLGVANVVRLNVEFELCEKMYEVILKNVLLKKVEFEVRMLIPPFWLMVELMVMLLE